jgi:geranylgeranyl diphosphate synthase type I
MFRPYLETLREFTLRGGKRFRALLVLAGFHLATGRAPRPALAAAVALEHFQSWMLVHDDIIDHAEERRGGRTVHRTFSDRLRSRGGIGDVQGYGIGMGITLGDLQEPFTVDSLLSTTVPSARRMAALGEYIRMARDTAYGQLLDIENGSRPIEEVTEEMVLLVHRLKSAVYTVVSPLRIGAALGGGRPRLLEVLEAIGTDLGIAFQLRDDVLGAGFDAAGSGKSTNDLVEGKRTLLVVKSWNASDSAGRRILQEVLGNPEASTEAIDQARQLVRSTGSLDYSENRIHELYSRANQRIRRSRVLRREGKSLLEELGQKLVFRQT